MKHKAIIFFGQHGTGKGTQAKLIAKRNKGYFHFSSGQACRDVDPNTEIGKKVHATLDQRGFIEDPLMFELFDNTIKKAIKEGKFNPKKDYLLVDGIPYTSNQVKLLNERAIVKQVIYYYVEDENILIKRLQKRAKNERRSDDRNRELIKQGLKIYETETGKPIKDFDPKLIVKIDASGTIEEMYEATMKHLIK